MDNDTCIGSGKVTEPSCETSKKTTFRCSECQKSFITKEGLELHRKHPTICNITKNNPFRCSTCKAGFVSKKGLRVHKKRAICTFYVNDKVTEPSCENSKITPFRCSECQKPFTTKEGLLRHRKNPTICNITKNNPFRCSTCKMAFSWKRGLASHEKRATCTSPINNEVTELSFESSKQTRFNCLRCQRPFISAQGLEDHHKNPNICEISNYLPYRCCTCKRSFSLKNALIRHGKIATCTSVSFRCSKCNEIFQNSHTLYNHEKRDNCEITQYRCSTCKKYFISKKNLSTHEKRGVCGKKSLTAIKRALRKEEKVISVNRKPVSRHDKLSVCANKNPNGSEATICSVCNKDLTEWETLKEHVNMKVPCIKRKKYYARVWNFSKVCPRCNMSFRTLANLRSHVNRKKECINLKAVIIPTQLNVVDEGKHMCTVKNGSNYFKTRECKTCGERFKDQRSFTRHVEVHKTTYDTQIDSKASRTCPTCNITFSNTRVLTIHLRSKTGCSWRQKMMEAKLAPTVCPTCGKNFFFPCFLRNHMSRQNPCTSPDGSPPNLLRCPKCLQPFFKRFCLRRHIEHCNAPDAPDLLENKTEKRIPDSKHILPIPDELVADSNGLVLTHASENIAINPNSNERQPIREDADPESSSRSAGRHVSGRVILFRIVDQ